MLVLDDVQRADVDAVRVLTAIDQSLAGVRAMLVTVYRDEEVGAEFDDLLGSRPVIRLGGVRGTDLAAVVALELEGPPPARLVDAVGRVTGGNPAFIQETIHGFRLAAAGAATHDPPVPDGARHVITQRLSRLRPDERNVLRVAACFGTTVDVDLLAAVTGRDVGAIRGGLRRATALRLVATTLDGGWRFAGEAARRVLAERVDEDAAARFHASAADHLELRAAVSDDAPAATIAAHLLATRGVAPERLVQWVGAAADQLLVEGGAEQAAALVARGLAVVGPDPVARGALLLRLGLARRAAGSERSARAAFLGAANAARTVRDGDLFARASLAFVRGGLEPSTGRSDAVPLLEEALAVAPGDDAIRARIEASLAIALAGDSDATPRRVELTTEAYDRAFRSGDAEAIATALGAWHWTLFGPDLAAERLDAATQMVRRAEQAGDLDLALVARRIRHHDLLEQGDVAAADIELAAFTRTVDRLRLPSAAWRLGVMRATRALLDGRFDEAEQTATTALRVMKSRTSSPVPAAYLRVQMMVRARELGRLDTFERVLRTMVESRPDTPVWRAVQAYLLAETGRGTDAARRARALPDRRPRRHPEGRRLAHDSRDAGRRLRAPAVGEGSGAAVSPPAAVVGAVRRRAGRRRRAVVGLAPARRPGRDDGGRRRRRRPLRGRHRARDAARLRAVAGPHQARLRPAARPRVRRRAPRRRARAAGRGRRRGPQLRDEHGGRGGSAGHRRRQAPGAGRSFAAARRRSGVACRVAAGRRCRRSPRSSCGASAATSWPSVAARSTWRR